MSNGLKRSVFIGTMLRRLLVCSFCTIWMSGGVLAAQLNNVAKMKDVDFTDVYISLPVYITSIIATAFFTWTVAKYDNKKISELTLLNNKVEKLLIDKKK